MIDPPLIFIAAAFLLAGLVKGVIGLGIYVTGAATYEIYFAGGPRSE